MYKHDIFLSDGNVMNTILGKSSIRKIDDVNQKQVARVESEIMSIPNVYEYLDTCSIYVVFSMDCNFHCEYCFERGLERKKSDINFEDIKGSLELLLKKHKRAEVVLYGGEPFLASNRKNVEKLVNYSRGKNIKIRAITNGSLLKKYPAEMLKQIDEYVITIDGPETLHNMRRCFTDNTGTYSIILENIKYLLEIGCKVTIRVNVDYENEKYIFDLIDNLPDTIVSQISIVVYRVKDNCGYNDAKKMMSLYDYHRFFKRIKAENEKRCKVKSGEMVYNHIVDMINSDKTIYPRLTYCGYYYVIADNGIFSCTEAIGDNRFRIENHEIMQYKIKNVFETTCDKCEVNTICGGGCKFARENHALYCEKEDILMLVRELCVESKNAE